mgnify:CR=1 FL=1
MILGRFYALPALFFALLFEKIKNTAKKISKKFGGLKKVRIFAARLRKNGQNTKFVFAVFEKKKPKRNE